MSNQQLSIEEILLQQRILTADQLSQIKLESINSGKSPEKIMLERNIATPDVIAEARSITLGVPYIKLEARAISPEAINLIPEPVARRYKLIPFDKDLESISVAMVDPLDLQVVQFIEKKSGLTIKRFLGLEDDIMRAIGESYSQNLTSDVTSALKEVSAITPIQERQAEQTEVIRDAPVANIVTQLLDFAVKSKASDIHIEPQDAQTRVRYRIDGILHEKIILPKKVHDAVVSRIKILSHLKIDERRLPQDGRFDYELAGSQVDLRISTLPTVFGEKVVMRLLPKSSKAPTLTELGLRANALKNLEVQLLRPHGVIIICGPTGSGKTTTLYSVLSRLATSRVNVLTIEDPVEYQIPGVNQVQVNTQIGLTFASALRSFLRQDPNIILVGEVRDIETADLAVQASLTGHQVFTTLHTNSASGSLPRLLDMGAEPFLLASAINAIVGQRILRKVCMHCRVAYTPLPEVIENIKQTLGRITPSKAVQLFKGGGCSECGNTGYQGRTGIYEVLTVSEKIHRLILERASTTEIEKQSVEEGMITMKQDGYLKALEGITTLEEVLRVAQD
ncbi:MAG: General secretory pathway protein E [Candidatus Daviesbacteria bacterium GW2011_GWA2_38_24]|uniref:General secretory pathway protein E n=1 Tax=Candidatus Daviesbacteria bacterium GW2011_GWA2_38_24 TaxID=1618422 RepID=A0A0G0LYF1_9BACT|nr:MAG: General secretory pathway protein E [Candidatus Daviesbacteria bacterium GW2011_GWA2_38_24]KKQ79507.1 MAG: General secretory pathway protein E [Candidatus Daviesbacteria bacterium GW2011_GWA1_38_7]OGE24382.1 MAG: hypothetical protein A2688_01995 [Candidatus Daviesbacteria bacterium RIFCSPHIGHO2_01_FULL_38_8]